MMNVRAHVWLGVLLLFAGVLAWRHAFIIDDAFISFTYARNFSEGHGLVWYPGSSEFGYTNFLFTLLVGCLAVVGIEPLYAAYLISVPAYLASLLLLYDMVTRMVPHARFAAYGAAFSVAVHFTVSSYATSGLETSLHMLLMVAVYRAAFRQELRNVGVIASLALLCRLDSAVLLVPAFLYLTIIRQRNIRTLLPLYAIPFAVLVVFLLSCHAYYGEALPSTFYAKMQQYRDFYPEGREYIATFLAANGYAPLLLLVVGVVVFFNSTATTLLAPMLTLLAACALWLLYIIYIGGDFMEFRLFVPILPLFYAACFIQLTEVTPRIRPVLIAGALALNVVVGLAYAPRFLPTNLIGSLPVMDDQMTHPRHNWPMVGQALHDVLYSGKPDDVLVAMTTTGAIPYYSRLPSLDLQGLNDRFVAHHGEPAGRIAGHRKMAPFSYLQERKVNLVIPWLPAYVCDDAAKNRLRGYYNLPALLIPLASDCKVVAYYLTTHPRVEELIRNNQVELILL